MAGLFFLVVLAVQHVPFVGAFDDGALLGLDLAADERVDRLVGLHLALDHAHDLLADLLRVREVLDRVVSVEVVQHGVRDLEDLLAAELHRMMPFSFASRFLTILNISE